MSIEKKVVLDGITDVQENIKYELEKKDWDNLPDTFKGDIFDALEHLMKATYAAVGYSTVHPAE